MWVHMPVDYDLWKSVFYYYINNNKDLMNLGGSQEWEKLEWSGGRVERMQI